MKITEEQYPLEDLMKDTVVVYAHKIWIKRSALNGTAYLENAITRKILLIDEHDKGRVIR